MQTLVNLFHYTVAPEGIKQNIEEHRRQRVCSPLALHGATIHACPCAVSVALFFVCFFVLLFGRYCRGFLSDMPRGEALTTLRKCFRNDKHTWRDSVGARASTSPGRLTFQGCSSRSFVEEPPSSRPPLPCRLPLLLLELPCRFPTCAISGEIHRRVRGIMIASWCLRLVPYESIPGLCRQRSTPRHVQ